MRLFGEVNVVRGSVAWTRPFRLRLTRPAAVEMPPAPAAVPEYDEEGRLYVSRFARSLPQQYTIERDRIFDYMKRRKLPDAGQRQIRRDLRNSGDLYADVRDLEFHPDIEQA